MTTRKEMVPPPVFAKDKHEGWCKPEWDLLCRIRTSLRTIIIAKMDARTMRKKLIGLIANMDDVFDDFPKEDPN